MEDLEGNEVIKPINGFKLKPYLEEAQVFFMRIDDVEFKAYHNVGTNAIIKEEASIQNGITRVRGLINCFQISSCMFQREE